MNKRHGGNEREIMEWVKWKIMQNKEKRKRNADAESLEVAALLCQRIHYHLMHTKYTPPKQMIQTL